MREGRLTHFDPGVLDVFFENLDDVLAIKERYRDRETSEPSVQPPFAK
jgi:putative two-component system response regulator